MSKFSEQLMSQALRVLRDAIQADPDHNCDTEYFFVYLGTEISATRRYLCYFKGKRVRYKLQERVPMEDGGDWTWSGH